MAKLKRRPTLREQVYRVKRRNKALERDWDEADRDFVKMTHNFDRMAHIAKQAIEQTKQAREETKQIFERLRASLESTTRDPPMRLQ